MANSADPDQTPTDLDLHGLQRQGISGITMTRVNINKANCVEMYKTFITSQSPFLTNQLLGFIIEKVSLLIE